MKAIVLMVTLMLPSQAVAIEYGLAASCEPVSYTLIDDKPASGLLVVIHPANYNFVFSSGEAEYDSTFGAKVVADYTKGFGDFNIKSNLSIFFSYEGSEYSNYTWTNSFTYSFWKSVGVGFDFGLRKNHQEALNYALETDPDATFDNVDNELQSFWLLGLNITLD